MKLNPTVALTLVLLVTMLGAGFVSAMGGFTIGHQALKGVTQPDVRPTNKLASSKQKFVSKEGVDILREEDILKKVRVYIDKKNKDPKKESVKSKKTTDEPSPQPKAATPQIKLPIKTQDQQVTLQVRSVNNEGSSLLLNVSLKNEGTNAVRFLYSFLNVTDNQGRTLSALTEGLPAELPANGEEFFGTVSIPAALLDDVNKLSLTLTDYPDQKLQLKMSDIPVVR